MQPDTTPPESSDEETLFEGAAPVPGKKANRSRAARPSQKDAEPSTPPSKNTSPGGPTIAPGDELEIRLARMQFLKGAYTRRGVNLERHFHPEPLLVTDLDLLSFEVTARLTLFKTIGEAKSGTGKNAPKPLDRAIWMAGLKQLVDADGGIVITALRPSARVRETVRNLGVTAMSVEDLARWEATHLTEHLQDVGAQGPGAFAADALTRITAKGEPKLERTYWFLRSEVWFLETWQATKRLIGALVELRRYWTPEIDDDQTAALRWMYAETLSILSLQLVVLVGRYQASNQRDWPALVRDRLAEGAISTSSQRALSDAFDRYLAHILGELKAPSTMSVETMGAFHPSPPDWADGLIELITRLEAFSGVAELPRQTDLVVTERLVRRRRESQEALLAVSNHDPEEFSRMRRQIAAFIRGAVELPDAVDKALIT